MTPADDRAPTIHAGCVVLGSAGVLIRGPSGSGKSTLALALIEDWRQRGLFSALVSDDRVHVSLANGRLLAAAPPQIRGMVEQHGRGVRSLPDLPRAVVRLIVDLLPQDALERMPDPAALSVPMADVLGGNDAAGHGALISRQPVPRGQVAIAIPLVRTALCDLEGRSGRIFT